MSTQDPTPASAAEETPALPEDPSAPVQRRSDDAREKPHFDFGGDEQEPEEHKDEVMDLQ